MARPRALILGGAGYFGSRLAEDLAETHHVVVTYRSLPLRRKAWLEASGLDILHYDSATMTSVDTGGPIDLLVNLAMPGAREAARDTNAALTMGRTTAGLCAGLVAGGKARRLIHLSTFHVYGGDDSAGYAEDGPVAPLHAYGRIHLEVEQLLQASDGADRIYILRATNLAGAPAHLDLGDQAGLVFLDLCRQAAQDGRMVLGNDGASYRDMLPFTDAIAALRRLAGDVVTSQRLFNLAAGRAMSLRSLAKTIAAGVPRGVDICYGTSTDAHRAPFEVNISRLTSLGWQPELIFAEEVAATLDAFW
jgi:nucleoside-diphosphate-sugar epimerase